MSDRARQFMPFDALKGYKEAIKEKEKIKVDKIELSEDAIEELNKKLSLLKNGMMVKIIYFKDNEYLLIEGLVSKIDIYERYLTIVKTKIFFDDLKDIQSDEIKLNDF